MKPEVTGVLRDVWRGSADGSKARLRTARVKIPPARSAAGDLRSGGSGRAAGRYHGSGHYRGRPTRLWQDDADGAVGGTDRVARGVAVLRQGGQRPRCAAERS